jgi:membrane dipeptidase
LYQAHKLSDFSARSNKTLKIIRNAKDMDDFLNQRQLNSHCVGGILAVEGAHALDGNLDNVDVFYKAGIRMMGVTHFFDNDLGGSAHGIAKGGLTDKGRSLVQRMQSISMIVDLAHASPAIIRDVLAISQKPVLASHTGVKGTCNNGRNLSDAEIKGIAKTGGLIGIGYWKAAVCGNDAHAIANAIRYTSEMVGVEHVALGSDFDGAITAPFDSSRLIFVTQALIDEGFADDQIRAIMGGNAIRLFRQQLPSL